MHPIKNDILACAGQAFPVFSRFILRFSVFRHSAKYVAISNIKISDDYGIDPKMKESLLMAVLAVARIQNLPANMPSVSGADRQTVMGNILRPEQDQYLTREKN